MHKALSSSPAPQERLKREKKKEKMREGEKRKGRDGRKRPVLLKTSSPCAQVVLLNHD
jgi:hypothetical protein